MKIFIFSPGKESLCPFLSLERALLNDNSEAPHISARISEKGRNPIIKKASDRDVIYNSVYSGYYYNAVSRGDQYIGIYRG